MATFGQFVEAHLARTQLEEAGIVCQLADEQLVAVDWLYAQAVGGVRLQVDAKDAKRAKALLDAEQEAIDWASVDPSWAEEEREVATMPRTGCPQCRCADVLYEPFDRRLVFLSILLLGVPLPFLSRTWRCDRCGHQWKHKLFVHT